MKRRLWKRLFCIILASQLIYAQVAVAQDNASITNVYAATQKDFYRYLNEFTKGGYASLTIHFDKGAFAVDEYRKGNSTENTVLWEVSPFHTDMIGIYLEGSSQYYLRYMYDDSQSKAQRVEKRANAIIAKIIRPNMTKQQRVTAIARYMKKNIRYNSDGVRKMNQYVKDNKIKAFTTEQQYPFEDMFSAYGALCKGRCVCEGYTRAFNLLARKAGVPAVLASTKLHAWSIYKINGKYYEIDTTKAETKGHLIRKTKKFAQQNIYKKLFSYVITGSEHVEMTPYGNDGEN